MEEQQISLDQEKVIHSLENLDIDVDKLYKEMSNDLEVRIDLAEAPDISYINSKMVACREAAMKAQRSYLKIQRALGMNQKWLLNLETTFSILSDAKLENDAEVRSGASAADRQAMANNRLVDYKRAIKEAKNNVALLKALNKAIDLCISNIDKTENAIKQQARLMEAQMKNLKTMDAGAAARDKFLSKTMTDMDSLEELYQETQTADTFAVVGSDDTAEPVVAEEEELTPEDQDTTEVTDEPAVDTGISDSNTVPVVDNVFETLTASEETDIILDTSMEDGFTIAPGLTGMPANTVVLEDEPVLVADDEVSLDAFLDKIPDASKDEGTSAMMPTAPTGSSDEEAVTEDDPLSSLTGDDDDPIASMIMESGSLDTDDATSPLDLSGEDVFGGLVESTTVTEQKVPKILHDEVKGTEPASKPTKNVPELGKVLDAVGVQAQKPAAKKQSIDDIMNDLGL